VRKKRTDDGYEEDHAPTSHHCQDEWHRELHGCACRIVGGGKLCAALDRVPRLLNDAIQHLSSMTLGYIPTSHRRKKRTVIPTNATTAARMLSLMIHKTQCAIGPGRRQKNPAALKESVDALQHRFSEPSLPFTACAALMILIRSTSSLNIYFDFKRASGSKDRAEKK
jgi:hypothetical protein